MSDALIDELQTARAALLAVGRAFAGGGAEPWAVECVPLPDGPSQPGHTISSSCST
jgi:hypothetical protein